MIGVSDIIDGFKRLYDRMLGILAVVGLVVSLLYLAVQVGTMQKKQTKFENIINKSRAARLTVEPIDQADYKARDAKLREPFLFSGGTNIFLTIPETRVWCIDCKKPIPESAMVCVHCLGKQPPIRATYTDYDDDLMLDEWELKYGLNPKDPDDAQEDTDGDKFVNLQEHDAGTDPTNALDFPPIEDLIVVKKIKAVAFELLFMSAVRLPDKLEIMTPSGKRIEMSRQAEIRLSIGGELKLPGHDQIDFAIGTVLLPKRNLSVVMRSPDGTETGSEAMKDGDAITLPQGCEISVAGSDKRVELPADTRIRPFERYQFALNERKTGKTLFVELNKEVPGFKFKVTQYDFKEADDKTVGGRKDVSELTLSRGGKKIVLVKGVATEGDVSNVDLYFELDSQDIDGLKIGDTFIVREKKYELIVVNASSRTVRIRREDGKEFDLRMRRVENED